MNLRCFVVLGKLFEMKYKSIGQGYQFQHENELRLVWDTFFATV